MRVHRMARFFVGTSGWHYAHWVGNFYPAGMKPAEFLPFYQERFDTVEVNNSFYRLPSAAAFAAWAQSVPPGFVFAVKASRFLTHMKKLTDPEPALARLTEAVEGLGDRLGPILFQLPPRWRLNLERLESFLAALPHGYRYAMEFREPSWWAEPVPSLLARYNVAFCAFDFGPYKSPVLTTASFAYVRLHGAEGAYWGAYGDAALDGWAEQARLWGSEGRDVYIYFDNDAAGAAPRDAARLRERLGIPAPA